MELLLWERCFQSLQDELPTKQFNTWIRPLQAKIEESELFLYAPNTFVVDYVKDNFLDKIFDLLRGFGCCSPKVQFVVGNVKCFNDQKKTKQTTTQQKQKTNINTQIKHLSYLNQTFTFDNFVEGKANQLARAAALQVSQNIGKTYNPFFIYGGVGLGKTHLMHAIGNMILSNNPDSNVLYLRSERFVSDMVKALQRNTINEFKHFYRSLSALLIDDIQFFAGKERSQEEFFHTFNSLLDGGQQIILTCDRYPKEISGLEERLKSRFGWGLTIAIEPPEFEMRVAILMNKAQALKVSISQDVAFFVAKNIQSNVRELEGALRRIIAHSHFTGHQITVDFAKLALKDLLSLRAKLVTIENIQKTTAEYFKIKTSDLLSKCRIRSITRPRHLAMALAKELTNHSLPEIGEAFGGKDHTTVMHACQSVKKLIDQNVSFAEDYRNLLRILSS